MDQTLTVGLEAVDRSADPVEIEEALTAVGRRRPPRSPRGRYAHPPGDWRVANAESLLGAAVAGQGRYSEAEPLLVAAAERMAPAGEAAEYKRRAIERVIELYDLWEASTPDGRNGANAAEWRTKLAEWRATTQPAD